MKFSYSWKFGFRCGSLQHNFLWCSVVRHCLLQTTFCTEIPWDSLSFWDIHVRYWHQRPSVKEQRPFLQESGDGWRKNEPSHWLRASASSLLQYFDTVGWVIGRASGLQNKLSPQVLFQNRWRKKRFTWKTAFKTELMVAAFIFHMCQAAVKKLVSC